jgi:hypothetical protein
MRSPSEAYFMLVPDPGFDSQRDAYETGYRHASEVAAAEIADLKDALRFLAAVQMDDEEGSE